MKKIEAIVKPFKLEDIKAPTANIDERPEAELVTRVVVVDIVEGDIAPNQRCPICWDNPEMRGIGYATSTVGRTRYCKCNRCAHTYKVILNT